MKLKIKKRKNTTFYTVFFCTCAFVLFGLTSCKKSQDSTPQPIAINTTADVVDFVLAPGNDAISSMSVQFHYNGLRYFAQINRVNSGNENGIVSILDTNLVSANSTLYKDSLFFNVIDFDKPTTPNSITVTIDDFSSGADNQDKTFNKMTLQFDANTIFYVQGFSYEHDDDSWTTTYLADKPGFTVSMAQVASFINNNLPVINYVLQF